jgi:hypothetical protein
MPPAVIITELTKREALEWNSDDIETKEISDEGTFFKIAKELEKWIK